MRRRVRPARRAEALRGLDPEARPQARREVAAGKLGGGGDAGRGGAPCGSSDWSEGPSGPRAAPERRTRCPGSPVPVPPPSGPPPPGSEGAAGGGGDLLAVTREPRRAWLEGGPGYPPWGARGPPKAGLRGRGLGWGSSVLGRRNYFCPALSLGVHIRQALPERGAPP